MSKVLYTAAFAMLLSVTTAHAQTQVMTNADQIWHGIAAGTQAGKWMDLGAVGAGDGRTDLIIGAPGDSTMPGSVYVIFGGPIRKGNQNLSTADTILTGVANGDRFGNVTAAGNVITAEGSLTRNLIVGAPGTYAAGGNGAVYVFMGGFTLGSNISAANAVYTIIGRPGDQLGTSLATADLDNDGYREIIIGAGGNDRLYVIKGGPSLSGTRDLAVTPRNSRSGAPASVTSWPRAT